MNSYPSIRLLAVAFTLLLGSCKKEGFADLSTTPDAPDPEHTLGPALHYPSGGIFTAKTMIADLNGDGRQDVATYEAGGYGSRVLVYPQNTAGQLDPYLTLFAENIRGAATGDVNGDGRDDLVLSCISGSATTGYLGRIIVWYQGAGGAWTDSLHRTVSSNNTGGVAVGDINADGRADVAVMSEWTVAPGLGNMSLFLQQANGELGDEQLYSDLPVSFTGDIQVADMNSDGLNDLVFQSGMLELSIWKQLGTGGFAALQEAYPVQTSYWPSFSAFDVGDLNDDGRQDVVVLDPGNSGITNLYFQNDGGGLDHATVTGLPGPLDGVEIGDINSDGLNDIAGESSGSVVVIRQSASHAFTTWTTYPFQTQSVGGTLVSQALSLGDVTGDGHLDAVVGWMNEGIWVLPSTYE